MKMTSEQLEKKIAAEKKARKIQIAERIGVLISVLLVCWILASWVEVLHHNDVYYNTGVIESYSPANFFEIFVGIGENFNK